MKKAIKKALMVAGLGMLAPLAILTAYGLAWLVPGVDMGWYRFTVDQPGGLLLLCGAVAVVVVGFSKAVEFVFRKEG